MFLKEQERCAADNFKSVKVVFDRKPPRPSDTPPEDGNFNYLALNLESASITVPHLSQVRNSFEL